MEKVKSVDKELPDSINVVNHVSTRIKELRKIYNDVATSKSEMLIHQMLPNNMRRRAMSHNPKRLPAKYRQIHTSQMAKSGLDDQIRKRPSRKYRRKRNNLLKEYARRSKNNVWLETHIWHAKRFRMKKMWGYKIPYTPTDKRYKASYRAAVKHCLLQDISYYSCIEISGPFQVLKDNLKHVINQSEMPTITARCFINGTREGKCTVFKIDSYPYDAISEVSFLWRSNQKDSERTLWIFSHPNTYDMLIGEFIKLFDLSHHQNGSIIFTRNLKYGNTLTGVSMISLKDTLNRFRLTGSHSNAVLSKALKVSTVSGSNWLHQLCSDNENVKHSHLAQKELWKDFGLTNSPLELPLHCVINLNIDDPRTNRNINKKTMRSEILPFSNGNQSFEVNETIADSLLWDKEIRDNITKSMMTSSELNKLRYKKQLIPAIPTSFEKSILQPIPILIVQQPNELMSGWDVIVPSGYGLSVWLSFVKFGAKAGGWREYEMIMSEMGKEVFAPDSVAGKIESESQMTQLKYDYFRRPPNKRTNFAKLGIASPFKCPYKELLNEWNENNLEKYFELRDPEALKDLSKVLSLKKNIKELNLDDKNCLIPVKVQMMSNGAPGDFSILCLPNKKDITYSQMTNHQSSSAFQENVHPDPNEQKRKTKSFVHKKLLKRLRNKRVRDRRKNLKVGKKIHENFKLKKNLEVDKIIKKQYEEMCDLWLPKPTTIRYQCSREVIGYVKKSRFTFSVGKVSSIGYVPAKAFEALIKKFEKFKNVKPFILIRSTNSNCYYTAKISI